MFNNEYKGQASKVTRHAPFLRQWDEFQLFKKNPQCESILAGMSDAHECKNLSQVGIALITSNEMPTDLQAEDLQLSVFNSFMTYVPIREVRVDRFPAAENTMVLISDDDSGGGGLVTMVKNVFTARVIRPLQSGLFTQIDNNLRFACQHDFFIEMAKAFNDSQNFARSNTASIEPAMVNLRTLVLDVLGSAGFAHSTGQLEGWLVRFVFEDGRVTLKAQEHEEDDIAVLGDIECEKFMGKMQAKRVFTVPNVPAIALSMQVEPVRIGHDILSKVAEVVKEADETMKPRVSDERLVQIHNKTGERLPCLRVATDA
jgi:hypothetical protein